MFRVSARQIEALEKNASEVYSNRLLLTLREKIPDALRDRTDEEIKSHIERSIQFSKDFLVENDESIAKIAIIGVLTYSEAFDDKENLNFMNDETYSGDTKADMLLDIFVGYLRSSRR